MNTSNGFFWTPHKTDTDKGRSRCKIFLKLTMKISKKKPQKTKASQKQRHVQSTPEKHFNKVLDMLQVVNKEVQSLLLNFN